jgi:hypothetical protein
MKRCETQFGTLILQFCFTIHKRMKNYQEFPSIVYFKNGIIPWKVYRKRQAEIRNFLYIILVIKCHLITAPSIRIQKNLFVKFFEILET